jgi:hypothetical protein
MIRLILIAALAIVAGGAVLAGGSDEPGRSAAAQPRPPDAPVRDCRDRITGAVTIVGGVRRQFRFRVRPRHDTRIGPVAFTGMTDAGRDADWAYYVREDQWLKSVALVRRGKRVTLEIPREQRPWMRLVYGGKRAATLAGCRRPATRAECGRGPRTTCRSAVTPFSGGFEIDYEAAPRQGRCAELLVWVEGERAPRRARIFSPPASACA